MGMHSPSEAVAEKLGAGGGVGRQSKAVRARTILSAYLFRPLPGKGIRIVALSQTDFGGGIPAWAQTLARKAAVQRFPVWASRLLQHCEQRSLVGELRTKSSRRLCAGR